MSLYKKTVVSPLVLLGALTLLMQGARPVATPARLGSATIPMAAPRSEPCSVALPDGSVLIAGGVGASGVLASAGVYGADGSFHQVPSMQEARADAGCGLLPDGTAMMAGGRTNSGPTNTVEIYDAAANAWKQGPQMKVAGN